jgi:hypothetical protein
VDAAVSDAGMDQVDDGDAVADEIPSLTIH